MPQATITYDTGYNRKLKSLLDEMDFKHDHNGTAQYHPTMLGYKMSNFHGDYAGEPSAKMMVGGGSPGDQHYVYSGNSSAYPPYMMSSGMLVNSGGRRAGIDGAVGGYSFNNFIGDVAHVGKDIAPDLIRSYMASGAGRRRRMKGGDITPEQYDQLKSGFTNAGEVFKAVSPIKVNPATIGFKIGEAIGLPLRKRLRGYGRGGSKVGDQIASVVKTLAPFAPLLLGLGRPVPRSKQDVVDALKDIGAKKSHSLKKLKELAMTGGYSFNDFIGDVAHVGKDVGPDVIRAMMASGAGKKAKASKKGGINLKDVLASTVPTVTDLVKSADPAIKREAVSVGNVLAKRIGKKALSEGATLAKSAVRAVGGSRNARAEIVKKVMKEKGLKLIEASKYVKAHGLYKK